MARAEANVARGTNSGCDVALRPRGSARVARAGGALGAPSGMVTRGRPCGAPRIGSVIGGIETITRGNSLPYLYGCDFSRSWRRTWSDLDRWIFIRRT